MRCSSNLTSLQINSVMASASKSCDRGRIGISTKDLVVNDTKSTYGQLNPISASLHSSHIHVRSE